MDGTEPTLYILCGEPPKLPVIVWLEERPSLIGALAMPSWNVLESTGRNGPGVPEWFTFQRADDFWSRISEKIETLAYVSPTIWILSRAPAFGTLPMPMFGYINTDVGYANMTLKRCPSSTMF